jgi:transposase
MPVPLSNDLRKRIIEAKEKGKSVKEIVENMNVKKSTIYNLLALVKETGSYNPRPNKNGRKPMLNDDQLQKIKTKIYEVPDISLEDLKEELQLPVCISALCRTINNKLHLGRKKNSSRKRAKSKGRKTKT